MLIKKIWKFLIKTLGLFFLLDNSSSVSGLIQIVEEYFQDAKIFVLILFFVRFIWEKICSYIHG